MRPPFQTCLAAARTAGFLNLRPKTLKGKPTAVPLHKWKTKRLRKKSTCIRILAPKIPLFDLGKTDPRDAAALRRGLEVDLNLSVSHRGSPVDPRSRMR